MQILSYFIFGLSICFLVLGVLYLKNNPKNKKTMLFFLTVIGSVLWGLGYSLLVIQTNVSMAVIFRGVGIVGSIFYAVFGLNVIANIYDISGKIKTFIKLLSIFGFLLCPFMVMPERLIYKVTEYGMNYEVVGDFWNSLYSIYIVLLYVVFISTLIKMRRKIKYQREKIMNNGLWLFLASYFVGFIVDGFIASFGFGACPGSTLSQFVSVYILYKFLEYENKNSLTFDNIFNHIHHSIEMPILIFNANRKLHIVSDAFYPFFDIQKGEDLTFGLSDLFIIDDENDAFKILGNNLVKECFTKNTKAYCSLTIEKVLDSYEDIIGYIVLVNDLTDKFKSISELKEAKEIAENASKSKDNFLANMSHEIRTPLNAIIGINNLLLNEDSIYKVKDYSKQIDIASKNLLGIVNDLFDFSKIQTGKLDIVEKNYDFITMIDDVTSLYKESAINKKLEYNVSVDNSIPRNLFGDKNRIQQCISNLINNAIKYTETGSVTINVFNDGLVGEDDINIIVEVQDTGIGIKKEDIDNVFVSFKGLEATNNRNFEGTGLGLTLVKRLMILMNGSLEIESEYGSGSTFILKFSQKLAMTDISNVSLKTEPINVAEIKENLIPELPIEKEENRVEEKTDGSEESVDLQEEKFDKIAPNAKILAVDDNKINLMVLKGLLKDSEAQIDICTNGMDALDKCRDNSYDIVFLDHMMPGMDGIETLKEIKAREGKTKNDVPIIVVTANAVDGARDYYMEQGFNDYISKPVDVKTLNRILFENLPKELVLDKTDK